MSAGRFALLFGPKTPSRVITFVIVSGSTPLYIACGCFDDLRQPFGNFVMLSTYKCLWHFGADQNHETTFSHGVLRGSVFDM